MRSHRLILLFVPGLALSQVAYALDVTVGDSTGSEDYDTVEEAIAAVAAAGAATTGTPHTITIVSANYTGGESNLNAIPAGVDDGTDATDVVVESDAAADTLAFTVPAIVSHADIELNSLVITGDAVDSCVHSSGGCTRGISQYEIGPITVYDANLTGDDLILQPGSPTGNSWRSHIDAVWVGSGDVTLSNFSAIGFDNGGAVVLRDDWGDQDDLDRHTFSLSSCTIEDNFGSDTSLSEFATFGRAPGVHSVGSASGAVVDCDFNDNVGDHVVFADTADLTIDLSDFVGNEGNAIYPQGGRRYSDGGDGMVPEPQRVVITNSTFATNYNGFYGCGGAIAVVPWRNMYWARAYGRQECLYDYEDQGTGPVTLDISDTTFTENQAYDGADIYYDDAVGLLTATGITSTDSYVEDVGGSVYLQGWGRFYDSGWDGGELFNNDFGGAIAASGDLECVRCTFDGSTAEVGGAVALYSDPYAYPATTYASIEDSQFLNAIGYIGAALAVTQDVVADVHDSQFLQNTGYLTGAVLVAPISVDGGEGLDGQQYSPGWGYQDQPPAQLNVSGSQFADNSAFFGGAFYVGGWNGLVTFEDTSFDANEATTDLGGGLEGLSSGAMGGTGVVEPGNALAIRDSVITNSSAETWGGTLFSGVPYPFVEWWYFDGGLDGGTLYGAPQPRECGGFFTPFTDRPYGADIVLDGVTVSDSLAESASVAYFGFHDHVRVLGSEFTGNVAVEDGTFYAENLERLEFSCNTFCTNDVTGRGSGIYIFDDGLDYNWSVGSLPQGEVGGQVGPPRDPRYVFENNVWQNNTDNASGGVIELSFCEGGVGSHLDTGFDTDTDTDSGFDTGAFLPDGRGRVSIVNNTFLENEGTEGLVSGVAADVRVGVSNNVFEDGAIGVNLWDTWYIVGGYNLWHDLADDTEGDAVLYLPDVTALTGDPVYIDHTAGQCDSSLPLDPTSPGFQLGNPLYEDWDGSRSSVGAYGGPNACMPDLDDDTFNVYLDCDDDNPFINTDATEIPYNGIDEDCDGEDECDVDGDTYLADKGVCGGDDCNDDHAGIHPGATDIPYDGIDQDCDGSDECDADGDGAIAEDCDGNDCDDTDATIYPGADEIPDDDIDQDCDDEDLLADADGDGHDAPEFGGDDCDDTDDTVFPGATEVPYDGIDQDCDGEDDCDADDDDVHATSEATDGACDGIDCDDTDPNISPALEDTPYDGIDQDCDGADLCDVDGDGFDAPECEGDDCDDNDPSINPGTPDNPLDDIDQDCSGDAAELYVTGGGLCGCDNTSPAAPWGAAGLFAMMLAVVRRRRLEE